MANVQYFNLCFDILDAKEKQPSGHSLVAFQATTLLKGKLG